MVKEILKYPNRTLRKKSEEIKEITEEINVLSQEMVNALKESQGIGLAASQIGVLKRVIIIQSGQECQTFINPKIVQKDKDYEIEEEGCLSFPGIFLKVKRAKKIEVEALNLKGEKIRMNVSGLLAIVFQHEIDHLNGVLFIDRVNFWQKLKIWNKLKKNESR